jgi:hypothetical protein
MASFGKDDRPAGECPDRSALIDFAWGKLPADLLAAASAHVESCGHCRAILDTLDPGEDGLLTALRNIDGLPAAEVAAYRPVVDAVS